MSDGLYQFLSMRGIRADWGVMDEMAELDRVASDSDAHAEWHRNTGQKYGCPWDCCEPPEPEHCPVCEFEYLDETGACAGVDHDARMADYLSARLVDLPPAEPEVNSDPWF